MRRTQMAAATAAAAALVLTACAGDPDDVGDGDGGEENTGGTVQMQIGDVPSLLVSDADDSESFRILKNLYDGLVYYDTDTGVAENLVAEDITTEDNQTFTITIQEGLTFHNGEPVNAESFIRSWNHTAYGANASGLNYFMARIKGYEDMNLPALPEEEWTDPEVPEFPPADVTELAGLTAPDEYTLQVELTEPFVGFPTMLGYSAFFPTAEACMEDLDTCSWNPIGNGPFILDGEYSVEAGGAANRWEDYADDRGAQIDRVEWNVYSGDSTCWADFLTGDIDICRPDAATFDQALNDPELTERMIQQSGTSFTALGFPLYQDFWADNLELRQAVSAAIDREAVINVIGAARGLPADGFVPPTILGGGTGACEYCEFDPELANQLLDAAGGWPEGETFEIWFNDDGDNEDLFRAIGDSIQDTLGIEYELISQDWPTFLDARDNQQISGPFRYGWGPDYNLNENYLTPVYGGGGPVNVFGYESAEFDAAIAAGDAAESVEEAAELYAEAERLVAAAMPAAPVMYSNDTVFYSERVDNVRVNPIYVAPGGDCELRDIIVVE